MSTWCHIFGDVLILTNEWFARNAQQCPSFFAAIRGARNGAIYGAKIRLPHALVTILLFGSGNLQQKLLRVLQLTQQHSLNLGKFVFSYKLALDFLAKFASNNRKYKNWHSFVAAAFVAYFVFGNREDGISEQINLYLLSRAFYAIARLLAAKIFINTRETSKIRPLLMSTITFPLFASLVWGVGLYLFENYPWSLQNSLRKSMEEIYKKGVNDPNEWGNGLWDFLFS